MTQYTAGDRVSHHLKDQEEDLRFGTVVSVGGTLQWPDSVAYPMDIVWDDDSRSRGLYSTNLFLRKVYDHDLENIS